MGKASHILCSTKDLVMYASATNVSKPCSNLIYKPGLWKAVRTAPSTTSMTIGKTTVLGLNSAAWPALPKNSDTEVSAKMGMLPICTGTVPWDQAYETGWASQVHGVGDILSRASISSGIQHVTDLRYLDSCGYFLIWWYRIRWLTGGNPAMLAPMYMAAERLLWPVLPAKLITIPISTSDTLRWRLLSGHLQKCRAVTNVVSKRILFK